MNEFYGISIAGLVLFILSIGDIVSMSASYISLLLVTTWYIHFKSDAKRSV